MISYHLTEEGLSHHRHILKRVEDIQFKVEDISPSSKVQFLVLTDESANLSLL